MITETRETQVTAPSPLAPVTGGQGILLYYRISAVTETRPTLVIAQTTPSIEAPVVRAWRQDHANVTVYWSPVPWVSKYVVTASGGAGGYRSVEVDPSMTSVLLADLAPGGNQSASVSVAVTAVYQPGSIVAQGAAKTIALAAVNACWPLATTPGPKPKAAGLSEGVTAIRMKYTNQVSGSSILYERSVSGLQAWETVGCLPDAADLFDVNLQPGTRYDYRATSFTPSSEMGQSLATRQTESPTVGPTPTAMRSGAASVELSWRSVSNADGYRVTSNYGYSVFVPAAFTAFTTLNVTGVPPGQDTFTVTVIYPMMRTGLTAPSSVTISVPVPSLN